MDIESKISAAKENVKKSESSSDDEDEKDKLIEELMSEINDVNNQIEEIKSD